MKLILSVILFLNNLIPVNQGPVADPLLLCDNIFDNRIRTVQLYRQEWNLSYPVIRLGTTDILNLNFDLLDERSEDYYYTFIHCDKDWNRSDIFPNDYIEGFSENPVESYKPSFNTTVNYYHYSLSFPNERAGLKLSGNYVIVVYPSGKPDEPVLTRRFMVVEDLTSFNVNVHRPQMTKNNNTGQQVDFTANHSRLQIRDPYNETFTFILQNGRWDTAKKNLKPDFYGNNELRFNSLSDGNIFPGGNEYRYFDIKSIRYQTEYVKRISYSPPYYNVYLYPSDNRESKPYFYWKDFNGKYYVAIQEGRNPDTDADYVFVYFTLPSAREVPDGEIYISGALTDWKYSKENLMTYNRDQSQYECTLQLKQGWYNYEYIFSGKKDKTTDPSLFEGNHFEAENDYLIFIYYRNPRDRYDRIIGNTTFNTLNRVSN